MEHIALVFLEDINRFPPFPLLYLSVLRMENYLKMGIPGS
jgi:hypothetical protein